MSTKPSTTLAWEHFKHGADIGVRGCGPSLTSAFEQAAIALAAVVADPAGVRPQCAVEIACEAPTAELLLYDWLNTIVFEMATKRLLFTRFEVSIDGSRLSGRAHGEPISRERHQPAVEVKGATMTELRVAQVAPGFWCAQCVVDV